MFTFTLKIPTNQLVQKLSSYEFCFLVLRLRTIPTSVTNFSRVSEAVLAKTIHSYQCPGTLPLSRSTLFVFLPQSVKGTIPKENINK